MIFSISLSDFLLWYCSDFSSTFTDVSQYSSLDTSSDSFSYLMRDTCKASSRDSFTAFSWDFFRDLSPPSVILLGTPSEIDPEIPSFIPGLLPGFGLSWDYIRDCFRIIPEFLQNSFRAFFLPSIWNFSQNSSIDMCLNFVVIFKLFLIGNPPKINLGIFSFVYFWIFSVISFRG